MSARVEVEVDIFSGRPNPRWVLTAGEAETFLEKVAALPRTSAKEPSGNLGYRGFVVQVLQGVGRSLIRVQRGTAHISDGAATVYAMDQRRELERWLLDVGKAHLEDLVIRCVEADLK
jgi:hypothetical protein